MAEHSVKRPESPAIGLPELMQAFGADQATQDPLKCVDALMAALGQAKGVAGIMNVAASHGELNQDDATWASGLIMEHLRLSEDLLVNIWDSVEIARVRKGA